MMTFNQLIPMNIDDLFERADYDRWAERFPVPPISRGASPEDIAGLCAGRRIDYLGVYVQYISQDPGSHGRDCLTLQLTDETGHMQALWTLSKSRSTQLVKQIGEGREAVVSGIIHEWPLGSGELRMVLDDVDFDKAILAMVEPSLMGTINTVMQIASMLDRLPKPIASIALELLESHWQELLNGIDYESLRHCYHGGILDHLRAVLKVLEYMWSRSGLDIAISDLAATYRTKLDRDGARHFYCPISMDHLRQVLVQMHRALDLNPGEPRFFVVCLAAVAVEIGKLSSRVRAQVVEGLSHTLKQLVDEYAVSREDADQVLNLMTRGSMSLDKTRSAEELALYLAVYLADTIG